MSSTQQPDPKKPGWLANLIIGLGIVTTGAVPDYIELRSPPVHTGHIIFCTAVIVLGALIIRPDPVTNALKTLGAAVLPFWNRGGSPPQVG